MKKNVATVIDQSTLDRLEALCGAMRRRKSDVIRFAIEHYLDHMEATARADASAEGR